MRYTIESGIKKINYRTRNLVVGVAASVSLLLAPVGLVLSAKAAPVSTAPGQNKLQCFDGTTDGGFYGLCTPNSNGAKGTATLDNVSNDATGTTNPYDQYSGVYILDASKLNGKLLGEVTQLSFNYTGTPTNGSPRLTLPIDTNGDNATDDYLSISAYWCNNGAGLVDPIHDATCTIFLNSDGTNPVGSSWQDVIAAHPTWKVTSDYPFLIADDPGLWTVGNVKLGKGGS